MSLLSDRQIQAQVSAISSKLRNGPKHYAIRSSVSRPELDRLEIGGVEHRVFSCGSELQLRECLLQTENENKPAVFLCTVSEDTLGEDVLERLAKRRIHSPDLREILAELFSVSASRIAPLVAQNKALMSALMDHVPSVGYPALPSGTLDLETAWLTLMGQIMGERIETPSLTKFLEWTLSREKLARLTAMNPELRKSFGEWLGRLKGKTITFMLKAMEGGQGADLVAMGVALGVVFDSSQQRHPQHMAALVRLERFFPQEPMDAECAQAWFRASDFILTQLKETSQTTLRATLNRLDEILATLGLGEQAWTSPHSPLGLKQRYDQAGRALKTALESRSSRELDEVRKALLLIKKHSLANDDPERVSRLEMALRLVNWLQTTPVSSPAKALDAMAVDYHQEGGFLDWARQRLIETDQSQEVQSAFDDILIKVNERREVWEKAFSLQLQDWTRTGSQSERISLIENVLKDIVTPVARQQPVLLLVLDGLSVAVFRQLLPDLLRHEWAEIVHNQSALPRPVLATLPSITRVSRRALFLGRLDPSTSGTEEGEFRDNDLLFKGSDSQMRPRLFKMGDLSDDTWGGIASDVRSALAEKRCRVVSVVLNAVDDHLGSGKQVDLLWTQNRIRGLRDLLSYAAEAGRLVIITSDHGHVLDHGTRLVASPRDGRGDRYRMPDGRVEEGEADFEGSRVQGATAASRITLACSTSIRYGQGKRGYHGGANPQEMVVPLSILCDARTRPPEGWIEVQTYQPAWWALTAVESMPLPPPVPVPVTIDKAVAGMELFEHALKEIKPEAPTNPVGWIDILLASPIYADQVRLVARGAPQSDQMRKLLRSLEARGGTVLKQTLAQDLAVPVFRVDGTVQSAMRILNVEGYEVLTFERVSETVTLNLGLLKTQFEINNP